MERLDNQDCIEVEGLDVTERAEKGFGSRGPGTEMKVVQPTICFLQADGDHPFYDPFDIHQHPILRKGQVLLSNAIIAKATLRTFEEDFLSLVEEAAMEDENRMRRKEELETLTWEEKELPKQWSISEGLRYYKHRIFIPNNEDLQTIIAKSCYDSKTPGHFGQEKTQEIITRDFYWKRITHCVNDYVRSCTTCQQAKALRHARFGSLSLLQVAYASWASISVDFITQIPNSTGNTLIIVVVARFTKMAHFIGLQENATAKEVAEAFLQQVWKLHGLSSEISLDRDAKFAGELSQLLCKKLGIKRKMSTAYHPQTDGQKERVNQVSGGYLQIFVNYDQDDWYHLLPLAEYAYNQSVTSAHDMTPFFANYGYHPQTEWLTEREAQHPGATLYAH